MEGRRGAVTKKIQVTTDSETALSHLQSIMLGQLSVPRTRAITKLLPRRSPTVARKQAKIS